ncbi:TauD/TfdA dioxygenase family protein [Actinomadura algeriensis]|uniref:Alpha-ketoglutarate-dependent taurine dioxygenase n=1 Tax=Actinomadura algeriensis TaxID=1679523 RepID=A0ABR9K1L6_9ACTN|nr:TauD/TfdA family dioxygenase [Actinomadura algeriensis]MBE1536735.1 alpha-ketoglutarate-dependent taurine dioxygenase [Actinomadura algeriensis]
MGVTFTALEPFGVEVTGASGGRLVDRRAADECRAALDEHGVVVYRELDIGDGDLVAFTRLLGEPLVAKTSEHRHPEIDTITLDPGKTNAALAAIRRGNFHWHIDGATIDVPQKATLLTAREVDPAGGDTEFANTFLAYRELSEAEKTELDGLRVVHSFAAAQLRADPDASERERASWERVSSKTHPLVWTRGNGRKSLLVGATAGEVVGLPAEDGRALLDRLTGWATRPRFVLRHRWRRGDLVIWDNTGMLHRAMPFEPTSRRLMHRTTLVGEEAVA